MMNEVAVLEICREATYMILKTGGPVMMAGMIVGLAISLFQALTTIQEMTLTFVPKILVILLAIIVFLPFMMTTMIEFTQTLFDRIATGG